MGHRQPRADRRCVVRPNLAAMMALSALGVGVARVERSEDDLRDLTPLRAGPAPEAAAAPTRAPARPHAPLNSGANATENETIRLAHEKRAAKARKRTPIPGNAPPMPGAATVEPSGAVAATYQKEAV